MLPFGFGLRQRWLNAATSTLLCVSTPVLNTVLLFMFLGAVVAQEPGNQQGSVPAEDFLTVAEKSGFKSTCSTAECDAFMENCANKADHIAMIEFGETLEKHPLRGLVFSNPPAATPPGDGRIVALVIGNIHSGECDGKEALLMLARELTHDADHPWLKKMVIVMVPNYNADANDQVDKDNRPGQVGPENGMGKRRNRQELDLNRDFMKLESPEARSLIRLANEWDPHVFIDCHTTNGSRHRYQLTYDVPHNPASPSPLRKFMREKMMPAVAAELKGQGKDTFYYGDLNRDNNRWTTFGYEPRFSTEYFGLRGRLGILSESYSYISYPERIEISRQFVTACLNYATNNADTVSELVRKIDEQWVELAGASPGRFDVPLEATAAAFEQPVTILGYKDKSDKPQDYECEFWGDYREAGRTALPYAYLFPASQTNVVENLMTHGIRVEKLTAALECEVNVQSIKAIRRNPAGYQGPASIRLQTNSARSDRKILAGTILVRTAQPLGRVAVWLLEPQSSDGLATWNYFSEGVEQGAEFPVWRIEQPLEISSVEILTEKPETTRN